MRKIFPLTAPGLKPPRVIEAIKRDVRKYLKRERRKDLPEGADFWAFDCKVGRDRATPKVVHVAELNHAIDKAVEDEWPEVYIEILAVPANRMRREPGAPPENETPD